MYVCSDMSTGLLLVTFITCKTHFCITNTVKPEIAIYIKSFLFCKKSQAEEVNLVRLREPDLEQPCVRGEKQTQSESTIDLLHSIIANWFEN